MEAATKSLSAAVHDITKQCAREDVNMDNIVDQEMAVSETKILCTILPA